MKILEFLEKYESQFKVAIALGLALLFMSMIYFYGHN